MPLIIPKLDDRNYQELVRETLARIPVHTPEWTNFNESDPGVTIVELFAFLTESLLYRSNQIPERNRRKFLSLLGIPLRPASSARGIVAFSNERGAPQTFTLAAGLEVRAGQVPFRTDQGLDLLPVETFVCFKKKLEKPDDKVKSYYDQLYASFLITQEAKPVYYQTTQLTLEGGADLADTVDGSLWVALAVRKDDAVADIRRQIAGKTLSLGFVPPQGDGNLDLIPGGRSRSLAGASIKYEIPVFETLSERPEERAPRYRPLDAAATGDVLTETAVVQITLPAEAGLKLWDNLDPLEAGVGEFPPALEDTHLYERIITWIRITPPKSAEAKFRWAGINSVLISQRAQVKNEVLPGGTGAPDQKVVLSRTPVVPGSVSLSIVLPNEKPQIWTEIDDLMSAGPEVDVQDQRSGVQGGRTASPKTARSAKVFVLNAESGEVRFGDGMRGARPRARAAIRASYEYGDGRAGNVNQGAIKSGPSLPPGISVTNPVPTWGGTDAESAAEGEKQISRFLQHRDRLVTASDFETIVKRTPGINIGRVDVIPAYHPALEPPCEPGDAAGAVTLMIVPRYDATQPDAPLPDKDFITAACEYVDSRRLVTTEVFLRGPVYKSLWISVGMTVVAGRSIAEVREAVKERLRRFLSPLPTAGTETGCAQASFAHMATGWPLRRPVNDLELAAEVGRAEGVSSITKLFLCGVDGKGSQIEMRGLQLPRIMGISVQVGDPMDVEQLRDGQTTSTDGQGTGTGEGGSRPLPVPIVPEECR
ncbi:MAG: hypothetical protein A2X58_00370 [Nitrospirae bacterium GWC2_56_14]|nr:MAG: hypothetical protein A2X58_00370 [Nitrospirae bacterium GWC2_56_14]